MLFHVGIERIRWGTCGHTQGCTSDICKVAVVRRKRKKIKSACARAAVNRHTYQGVFPSTVDWRGLGFSGRRRNRWRVRRRIDIAFALGFITQRFCAEIVLCAENNGRTST